MIKFFRLLQLFFITTALIYSTPLISRAALNCDLGNFQGCTKPICLSGCQPPCGMSCPSCCRPNPYCVCICDTLHSVWLPTTVAYGAPESVYGTTGPSGFASEQITLGNYAMVGLNPQWVLLYGYGIASCSCMPTMSRIVQGAGAIKVEVDSVDDHDWLLDKKEGGYIEMIPRYLDDLQSRGTRSKTDDRLLATSYTYIYRGILNQGSSRPEKHFWSSSPYTSECYPIKETGFNVMVPKYGPPVYRNFGDYLNKYDAGTYDEFLETPTSGEYYNNMECSDQIHEIDGRPVLFLWEEYTCCVLSGQVNNCY